jgi:hypothetical protein
MPRAAALSMKCPEEAMSKSMETLLRFRWSERPHSVVIAVPVVVLTWSVSDVISILFDLRSRGLPGFVFQPQHQPEHGVANPAHSNYSPKRTILMADSASLAR